MSNDEDEEVYEMGLVDIMEPVEMTVVEKKDDTTSDS